MTSGFFFEIYSSLVLENLLWYAAFVAPFFFVFWVWRKGAFQHLRIQKKERATRRHLWHDLRFSILTFFIFAILDTALFFLESKGDTFLYNDVGEYGWIYLAASFGVVLFLDDTFFYWSHRAMHHPKLYRFFHKVHHESTDPSPLTSFAFHPSEAVIENLMHFVLPFVLPLHWGVLIAWQLFSMANNVLAHLGYELYPKQWLQWPLLKYKTVSVHHNMHHQLFHGNYALYFTWWDRWMGTEFKEYEQRHQQVFQDNIAVPEVPVFHRVAVQSKKWETRDMVTFTFAQLPSEWRQYTAGQHITLCVQMDHQRLYRTFSISSIPGREDGLSISVKRIEGGKVTPYLLDYLNIGDVVELSAPSGSFVVPAELNENDTLLMIAGGSGITPIYSMLGNVLHHHRTRKVRLLFANREGCDVPFKNQLQALLQAFPQRFSVLWSARPQRNDIEQLLDGLSTTNVQCFVCGPALMAESVVNDLVYLGVPTNRISREWFTPMILSHASQGKAADVGVRLQGKHYTFQTHEGETILKAALRQDVPLPFACQSGLCGTCRVHCREGEVDMPSAPALSPQERADGTILTCQASTRSEKVVLAHPSEK